MSPLRPTRSSGSFPRPSFGVAVRVEPLETRRLLAAQLDISDSSGAADDYAVVLADTQVGQSSVAETFFLSNGGDEQLDISNLAVTGDDGDFDVSVRDNNNDPVAGDFSIGVGLTYTIRVVLSPASEGAKAIAIGFDSNDPLETSASLDASGTATAAPAPDLGITDSVDPADDGAVAFADTEVGQTDGPQTFSLTNSGDADLDISNLAVTGDTGDFEVTVRDNNSDPVVGDFSIPAGLTYTIEVTFSPTVDGALAINIDFDTNDASDPSVSLSAGGTGTVAPGEPEIDITDSVDPADDLGLTFGDTQLGTSSDPHTFTLTNSGAGDLDINDVTVGGTFPADYQVTILDDQAQVVASSSFTIPAGLSYTLQVVFAPQNLGDLDAQITFTTNDADEGDVTLTLNGTATESPAGPPMPPSGLTATAVSSGQINLNWTDNSQVEANFEVWEATVEGGPFSLVATLDADAASYQRSILSPWTQYWYRVVATNANGSAGYDEADAKTPKDRAGSATSTAYAFGKLVGRRTLRENVGTGDAKDWYRFVMPVAGTFRLDLTDLSDDADVALCSLGANGKPVTIDQSLEGAADDEFIEAALTAGTYYIRVWRADATVNTFYQMTLEADFAGNNLAGARWLSTLSTAKFFNDFVGAADELDYYKFKLASTRALNLVLTNLSDDADLALLNSSGGQIAISENWGSVDESISRTLAAGTYFIRIQGFGDTNYRLNIGLT